MMYFFHQLVENIFTNMFFHKQKSIRQPRSLRRQSGRAHVELVVLMTCLFTLIIVTSPGQSEPTSNGAVHQSTKVSESTERPFDRNAVPIAKGTRKSTESSSTEASDEKLCGLGHPPMPGVKKPSGC